MIKKEIAKLQKVAQLKNGVEYWLDAEEAEHLQNLLNDEKCPPFIKMKGDIVSKYQFTGLFDPASMEEQRRRKMGQWKDSEGNWHDRGARICPNCKQVLPEGKQCGNCFA